ncbi:MAG: hemolysin family protein [Alphaproteobacteria bacterium]|nr:hemolysin family protein [Alphaproteobacteria bacterium]
MNDVAATDTHNPSALSSWIGRAYSRLLARWQKPPEIEALREAVEELIEAQPSPSGAPSAEQTLLANVLNLRTREVGDCMIPRADIKAVDISCTMQKLLEVVSESLHSRIPVYRETLDDVLGMVHIKDILLCEYNKRECAIRDLLRPVLIVVPSMPATRLLLQMRQTRQHMAMVVDEFGGVDGLVTIEDLVEEIVGEIEDEHDDPATPDVIARADGTLLIDARMMIENFEERLGRSILSLEERETIDTIGGYVFHLAGHIPQIGEIVRSPDGLEFEILEADQARITRLRIKGAKKARQ